MRHYFLGAYGNGCTHYSENRCSFAQEGSQAKHEQKFQLSQAAGPLGFWKSISWDHYQKCFRIPKNVGVMTDRYSKLSGSICTCKITSMHLATILFGNCILPYSIAKYALANNCRTSSVKYLQHYGLLHGLRS